MLVSVIYLDYSKIDYEHELDAYNLGLEVHKRTSVINDYYPEVAYVHQKIDAVSNLETFPVLSSQVEQKIKIIDTSGHNSLNEFVSYGKNEGLTHIVIDNNENRLEFLKDVFKNEEEYAYLTKIYDSSEKGYDYHLKIFKINYEKFESGR